MRLTKPQGCKQPLWLHPGLTPRTRPLLLSSFSFQLLIGWYPILVAVSFSERTRPLETRWYVWESGSHVACTCCGCPRPLPPCPSHYAPPYSVSTVARKEVKVGAFIVNAYKERRPESVLVPLSHVNPAQWPSSIANSNPISFQSYRM